MDSPYHKTAKKSILGLLLAPFLSLIVGLASVQAIQPNDPSFIQQLSLYNQINLLPAWDISTGSRTVVVAIIDIGVDINHPDLAQNIWVNLDEIPNNKLDDDNNGYIDDVHGWNFIEDNNNVEVPLLNQFEDRTVATHGTFSAGIIGAVGNNNTDSVGINWKVSLMPVRAMGNSGVGSFGRVATAIDYAVANGADIINLSIVGYEDNPVMSASIKNARDKGVFIAAAVGNERLLGLGDLDKDPTYPVCMDTNSTDYVMGVTSIDSANKLSNFANYGLCVDISAPGQNIASTLYHEPQYDYKQTFGGGGNGTSFAVPFVSGAAALLKSVAPNWTGSKITQVLKQSADPIDNLNSQFTNKIGAGRLNINKAMQIAIADESYLASSYDYLYFSDGRNVYSFQPKNKEKYLIARVNDARLIGFSAVDIDGNSKTEVVLLIKRGNYYYVRTVSGDGTFISEIFLLEDSRAKLTSFDLFRDNGDAYLVVEKVLDGKKQLLKYSLDGVLLDKVNLNTADKWAIKSKDQIVTAKVQDTKLKIQIIDWFGHLQDEIEFDGVGELYSLEVGDVRKGGRSEQVVLVKRQGEIHLLIIDMPIKSWLRTKVANYDSAVQWRFMVGTRGGVILPYNTQGGIYTLLKDGNRWLGQINLPKLDEGHMLKTASF